MSQVYLVCEGERSSRDVRLLDAVLGQHDKLPIVIEPGGGGRNPRIVRSWLERRAPGDIAFLIHDRDYPGLLELIDTHTNAVLGCVHPKDSGPGGPLPVDASTP